ncbi:MAG: peptidylprolyl isomerase [Thaumarchaeota archaeon]|nr:peptidylprolyl isomerase [Nitrososphaerota archaeon]
MPKRSRRRGGKKSRRNTWIALALLVIIAVSGFGVYFVYSVKPSAPSTSTTTTGPGVGPYAVFITTQGTFVVQLYPKDAPVTVANFEKLVNQSFYTDLVWHRIVAGFVIQSGDPTSRNGGGTESTWGETGSGTTIPFENTGLPEGQGYIAMANTAAGGNGASSQFFINLVNNTSGLGNGYAVFGQVISGFSVVQAIGALPVNANCQSSGDTSCQPLTPTNALIDSITIQASP